jgi:hypothetical protein
MKNIDLIQFFSSLFKDSPSEVTGPTEFLNFQVICRPRALTRRSSDISTCCWRFGIREPTQAQKKQVQGDQGIKLPDAANPLTLGQQSGADPGKPNNHIPSDA